MSDYTIPSQTGSTPKLNVVAFLNPFPDANAAPRLEILLDWLDPSAWQGSVQTDLKFKVFVVSAAKPKQVPIDDTFLGSPVLTDVGMTPLFPDADISGIRKKINEYLSINTVLQNPFLQTGLNSIAQATHLDAFQEKGDSEPIRVPHPKEFHSPDPQVHLANSQRLLAHVAHLRLWNEKVVARAIAAQRNPKDAILTAGSLPGETPILEALRNAARNEPAFGRVFNCLYYFAIDSNGLKKILATTGQFLWLYAQPSNLPGLYPADVLLIPTRIITGKNSACSYLEQDAEVNSNVTLEATQGSFIADAVTAHQSISSDVFPKLPPQDHQHTIYTQSTKDEISFSIKQLRQSAKKRSLSDVKKMLRFKQDSDAQTFVAKGLDSLETDVQSLENQERNYDSIGIVWDHRNILPTQQVEAAHVGYKGYRVDYFKAGGASSTSSVERRLKFPSGYDVYLKESEVLGPVEGHIPLDCQNDPTVPQYKSGASAEDMELVVPREFHVFDGYNSTSINPLDQLLSTKPETQLTLAVEALVILKNISRTPLTMLKYRDEVGFCVRKLGMTGISPLCNPQESQATSKCSKPLTFLRFVPIQEPGTVVTLNDMAVQNSNGNGDQSSNLYQVTGDSPKLEYAAQCPLAHYKLCLHAANDIGDLDGDFNAACKSFVFRNQEKKDQSGFLRGLDPHAKSVEVVSKVWFPFSNNQSDDRFLVTGIESRSTDVVDLSFSDLVVKAQRMLAHNDYLKKVEIPVLPPGSYDPVTKLSHLDGPQVFMGLRNRIQCRGGYNPDNPQLSKEVFTAPQENPRITRSFTLNPVVHPLNGTLYPIGGDIDSRKAAKSLTTSLGNFMSLPEARLERYLTVPPTAHNTDTQQADSVTEPARGTPFQWRNRLMPEPYDGPDSGKPDYYSSNSGAFDRYRSFLASNVLKANFGATGPDPSPLLLDPGKNDYAVVASWSGKKRQLVVPGFHFPRSIAVQEVMPADPSQEITYEATIGNLLAKERHLPFIDDDISWIVRLQWHIDLSTSALMRPYDLAAVKEFRVFLTDGKPLDAKNLPAPIAVLPIPSRRALNTYDLDRVWWVFFDAVKDRALHKFSYHAFAVPLDEAIFSKNKWFEIPITIPNSTFDKQPERLVPLPLQANPNRGFAFVFDQPPALPSNGRVATRVAQAVADPLLADDPSARSLQSDATEITEGDTLNHLLLKACSDPSGLSSALAILFPTQPSTFYVQESFPSKPFATGPRDDSPSVDGWDWVNGDVDISNNRKVIFSQVLAQMDSPPSPQRNKAGLPPPKNPFLKFHIAYFDPSNYPRIRHTAGSDFLLSDWVQAFPDALTLASTPTPGLRIANAWGARSGKSVSKTDATLLFRFHVFLASAEDSRSERPAFHLSTFYTSSPEVSYGALRNRIASSLTKFGIVVPPDPTHRKSFEVTIMAEEGLWAKTSSAAPGPDQGTAAQQTTDAAFVVLRSSSKPFSPDVSQLLP